MLKKYLSKFTIDILPSILATIVGAYIVNYYIVPKARQDTMPPAAVAATMPAPRAADAPSPEAKPAETSADIADPAPSRPADKPAAAEKTEPRRHAPTREKAVAEKPKPAPAAAPVLATVTPAAETAAEERRNANDLARAAIERLSRGDKAEAPRTASVQPQAVPAAQQAQPMQQLPPPIVVSNPAVEDFTQARRLRPPGDVPVPMREMQANADSRSGRSNVVDDVLSGARSVFDKVTSPFER